MEHGGGRLDESTFPPGYRFQPFDDQLIDYYLTNKVKNLRLPPNRISEVKLYEHNPDYLVENYPSYGGHEWYFFTPRDRKYPNGSRPSRSAGSGYWKASGADKQIFSNGIEVGVKRTLVFYVKKSKEGSEKDEKSKWIMQEYVLTDDVENPRPIMANSMQLDDWVLCKIYERRANWSTLGDDTVSEVKPKENRVKTKSQPKHKLNNETRGRKRKPEKEVVSADVPRLEFSHKESLPAEMPRDPPTGNAIDTNGYIHGTNRIHISTTTPHMQFSIPEEPYYSYSSVMSMSMMDLDYNNHVQCATPISVISNVRPSNHNPVMPAFPMDYNYGFGSHFGYLEDEVLRFKEEISPCDSGNLISGTADVLPETVMPEGLPSLQAAITAITTKAGS